MGFTQFFNGIMTIIGTLVFMFIYSPPIALIVVIITPLSLFVASFIAKKTHSMFKLQSEIRGEQTSLVDEMITGHKTVSAFGQEDTIQTQFDEINGRLSKASLRAVFFSSLTNPSTRFVNSVVYALVALSGALLCVFTGGVGTFAMTVGRLSSFLAYATQYTKPFNELSGVITELQNALACAERVFELIEHPIQEPDAESAIRDKGIEGNIEFKDIDFSYVEGQKVLRNFNLSVKKGQKIAIVGATGSGKTTVVNLLTRFYEVDGGSISIDGVDIRDIPKAELRKSIGIVLQDTVLFSDSIRTNIMYGNFDATEEDMKRAAEMANAAEFIERLPEGYDTVLTEAGRNISQGQRQLLSIAGAILKDPKILILDEATSSVDTRTEMNIQSAMVTLMKNRTSLIIAHRLSTIRDADVIVVISNGHVAEAGRHEELLAEKGEYYKLYSSQFAGIAT